ncbi:MAG: phosphatase PAP2 family protein [Planctomycetes bacterium]|nr:phosphatase PAP2 family protein [Planctomycetota bacterium]
MSTVRILVVGVLLLSISFLMARFEERPWGAALRRDLSATFSAEPDGAPFVIARGVTELGDGWALSLVVLLAITACRRWRLGQDLVLGLTLLLPVLHTLKVVVGRVRPDFSMHDSWPSGHSLTTMAIVLLIVPYLRPSMRVVGILAACLVGLTRVLLVRHWPSDVIAGFGIACIGVGCVWKVPDLRWLQRVVEWPSKRHLAFLTLFVFYLDVVFGRAVERHPVHLLFAPVVLLAISQVRTKAREVDVPTEGPTGSGLAPMSSS